MVLDGAVVGWVETELARVVVDSVRRFKVCQLYVRYKMSTGCTLHIICAENLYLKQTPSGAEREEDPSLD